MKIGRPKVLLALAAALLAAAAPVWFCCERAVNVGLAFERPSNAAYRLSQVGDVTTYRPSGQVGGVALFLSGDGGWSLGVIDMAKALQAKGVAVAGISTPAFLKRLEIGKDKCIDPNFALMALAQDLEHRLGLPHYIKPFLVGYSSGATLAYAALARAPGGLYKGAVSLGFGPDIQGTKPWCVIGGYAPKRITKPEKGWLFPVVSHLSAPWIVLQGLQDQVVNPATTKSYASGIPEARLIELPKVGHGFSVEANWMPQFSAAIAPLLKAPDAPSGVSGIDEMPLTLVTDEKAPETSTMAVLYSGDGGWAGLDRDVAARLAARGIPVVGIDSLDYFWNAKAPGQMAEDLEQVIWHYGQLWRRPRILLVGYSFGADVLPFAVAKLPENVSSHIARMTMLGLDEKADLQFHLSSWVDISTGNSLATVPQIDRLHSISMQCVEGASEASSACPKIASSSVSKITLPGGHHFDGNAELIARTLTGGLRL